MEWQSFWEQFNDSIYSKCSFSTPSNWLTFNRLSRMAQLDMPSKACLKHPTSSSPRVHDSRSTFIKGWEQQGTASFPRLPSGAPASAQSDGLQTQSIHHITNRNEVGSSHWLRVAEAYPRHFEGA